MGKPAGMKLRNGNAPNQFCLCIDGIAPDATEESIYETIEAVEGLRDTKIYTGKSCRFVLCDFKSKESMRAFWHAAHCGEHGIDKFGFQVEVFEDPYGLISTKVFTLLKTKIVKPTEFKCSTTAYIPSDPLLCMTYSKYFGSPETKSEESDKGDSEGNSVKGGNGNFSGKAGAGDKLEQPEKEKDKSEAKKTEAKYEMKVENVKIDIPTNMFQFKPSPEELARRMLELLAKERRPKLKAQALSSETSTASDSIGTEKAATPSESKSATTAQERKRYQTEH
eukprot:TRINITY_DN1161_c0_g1_i2.p1 TRINITY_DN1161_c0_g1~~TRINITY_DN1161_c0_g1_i2.p1  ORF type:complete len:280 (-),score=67.87 TRINITY_DN1161_c0_g1_i2:439-1278(-)